MKLKPSCHMIATIAVISDKKKVQLKKFQGLFVQQRPKKMYKKA